MRIILDTEKEKKKMWELYKQYGTYNAVADKLHRSPDTVSRHVRLYETAIATAEFIMNESI